MNNINTSNEDNKHKYTDTDTRKLHPWARHVERVVFVAHLLMSCHMHLMAQDVLESSFHPHAIHERLSLTSTSSLSTSTCPSPSSSTSPSWCTLSRTPTSTTWIPCNTTCATPRRGVTTPATSSPHSHGLEDTVEAPLPPRFFSQHPGHDSQGPRLLPCDNHLLGCDDRCVVVTTAIFMDRFSCRQEVRRLRLLRLFCRPHCPPTIWKVRHAVSCRGTRHLPPLWNIFLAQEGTACVLCHSGIALCSSGPGHGLRCYHVPGKDASVKSFDTVLGKVHLPCLMFVVVPHGPGVCILASILSFSVAHAVVCLMFPVFWAWHCVFHVPVCCCHRTPWHAGGWHLRRKPRVLLLLCLLICSLNHDVPCEFWQLVRDFSSRDVDVWRSCFHRNFVFHALCYLPAFSVTVLDKMIGIRLDALKNYYVLVLCMLPWRIGGEGFSRTSLKMKRHVVLWHVVHTRVVLKSILLSGRHTFVFVTEFPYVRLCLPMETSLDPCWRVVSEGLLGGMYTQGWWFFRTAVHGEYSHDGTGCWLQRLNHQTKATWRSTFSTKTNGAAWCSYLGTYWAPGYCILLGKNGGTIAPPSQDLGASLSTPCSSVLVLDAWSLPLPSEEILSGYEDIVSSGTDQITTWVKTHLDATLVQHTVDV